MEFYDQTISDVQKPTLMGIFTMKMTFDQTFLCGFIIFILIHEPTDLIPHACPFYGLPVLISMIKDLKPQNVNKISHFWSMMIACITFVGDFKDVWINDDN